MGHKKNPAVNHLLGEIDRIIKKIDRLQKILQDYEMAVKIIKSGDDELNKQKTDALYDG